MKCSACKIIAHTACIDVLMDRLHFTCKPTFRDVGIRQYREQTVTHHHWVHRRSEKGKCKACGKVLNLISDLVIFKLVHGVVSCCVLFSIYYLFLLWIYIIVLFIFCFTLKGKCLTPSYE